MAESSHSAQIPDLTGLDRTVALIKYTVIIVFLATGSWAVYFSYAGHYLVAAFDVFVLLLLIVILYLLRQERIKIAAHLTFYTMYLFIVTILLVLEGWGGFPFMVNHLYIIPCIPAAFMFFYFSSKLTRYGYALILIFTFLFFEYNPLQLRITGMLEGSVIQTEGLYYFARTMAVLVSALVVTYLFYLFSQKVYETEEALVEANNKLESIVEKLLPKKIAENLRNKVDQAQDKYSECTILASDIVGFTPLTMKLSPDEVLNLLNGIFFEFDQICEKYGLEKIKTIGDAYILAGGIPDPMENHAEAVVSAAREFLEVFKDKDVVDIRIGIHSGEVSGGIIGKKRFIYDLWGKAVTISTAMESQGVTGKVHVSQDTYHLLKDKFSFTPHGEVKTEWGEKIKTYLLDDGAGIAEKQG